MCGSVSMAGTSFQICSLWLATPTSYAVSIRRKPCLMAIDPQERSRYYKVAIVCIGSREAKIPTNRCFP